MDMLCFQHFLCPFKDKCDPLMSPEIQTGFLLRLNPAVSLAKENILSQPSGHISFLCHITGSQIVFPFPETGGNRSLSLRLLPFSGAHPYDILGKGGNQEFHIRFTKITPQNSVCKRFYLLKFFIHAHAAFIPPFTHCIQYSKIRLLSHQIFARQSEIDILLPIRYN